MAIQRPITMFLAVVTWLMLSIFVTPAEIQNPPAYNYFTGPTNGKAGYNGGRLLTGSVTFHIIFYGPNWPAFSLTGPSVLWPPTPVSIATFVQNLPSSEWWTVMYNYPDSQGHHIAPGNTIWGGSYIDSGSLGNQIQHSQLDAYVTSTATAQGWTMNNNVIIMLLLDSSTMMIDLDKNGVNQYCAAYGGYHTPTGAGYPDVRYIIAPGQGCPNGAYNQIYAILSHEIAETFTDPDIPQLGWLSNHGELGDMCGGLISNVNVSGITYPVQSLWQPTVNWIQIQQTGLWAPDEYTCTNAVNHIAGSNWCQFTTLNDAIVACNADSLCIGISQSNLPGNMYYQTTRQYPTSSSWAPNSATYIKQLADFDSYSYGYWPTDQYTCTNYKNYLAGTNYCQFRFLSDAQSACLQDTACVAIAYTSNNNGYYQLTRSPPAPSTFDSNSQIYYKQIPQFTQSQTLGLWATDEYTCPGLGSISVNYCQFTSYSQATSVCWNDPACIAVTQSNINGNQYWQCTRAQPAPSTWAPKSYTFMKSSFVLDSSVAQGLWATDEYTCSGSISSSYCQFSTLSQAENSCAIDPSCVAVLVSNLAFNQFFQLTRQPPQVTGYAPQSQTLYRGYYSQSATYGKWTVDGYPCTGSISSNYCQFTTYSQAQIACNTDPQCAAIVYTNFTTPGSSQYYQLTRLIPQTSYYALNSVTFFKGFNADAQGLWASDQYTCSNAIGALSSSYCQFSSLTQAQASCQTDSLCVAVLQSNIQGTQFYQLTRQTPVHTGYALNSNTFFKNPGGCVNPTCPQGQALAAAGSGVCITCPTGQSPRPPTYAVCG